MKTQDTQDKEYAARVRGDGKVQLKPIVTEVKTSEGVKEVWYKFATERQKEKLRHGGVFAEHTDADQVEQLPSQNIDENR